MVKNIDETVVRDIAGMIPGVSARLGTPEEDCGYHKADVVLTYSGKTFYVQVSHTAKSKKEQEKLSKRGTYSVYTNSLDRALSSEEIANKIKSFLYP
ncbi:hypothetical protein M0R19_00615 [Candidatus Pacearchaeota archaeon]|jgi:hypothetical protein|nr:hypothetical protein [Candidatus Pacearchaeota archaeon]